MEETSLAAWMAEDFESLLRTIAAERSAAMWQTDLQPRVTSCVGTIPPAMRVRPHETEGMSLPEFFRIEGSESFPIAAHRRALEGVSSSGEWSWGGQCYHGCIVPRRDSQARVIGCLGFAQQADDESRSQRRFRQLLESAPDAMVIVDGHGAIRLVNIQTERLFGYARDELLGQSIEMLVPRHKRDAHAAHRMAFVEDPRSRPMGAGPEFEGRRKGGGVFPAEISLSPIETDEGVLISAAIRDVTERQRARREIERNLQVQSVISAMLRISQEPIPLAEHLERMLDLLLATEWIGLEPKGAVFLAENDPRVLTPRAVRGLRWRRLYAGNTSCDGDSACWRAAATGRIVFVEAPQRPGQGEEETLLSDECAVPIISGGQIDGVIVLYPKVGFQWNGKMEAFFASVADVLAGAIKHCRSEEALRKNEAQLLAAQQIQRHLLPQNPPAVSGYDIHGTSKPAEFAGGDYFDYLHLREGVLGIVVGDVSGHGVASALLAASTQAHLRSLAETRQEIGDILARANASLCRETEDQHFVTLLFARLELPSRELTYAGAGHPAGYVLAPDGRVKAELPSAATPLAVDADADFPVGGPVALDPGDLILLLTDGLLEARSPEGRLFGTGRLLDVVRANRHRSAEQVIHHLCEAVDVFCQTEKPLDDVTAVIIKVQPENGLPGES